MSNTYKKLFLFFCICAVSINNYAQGVRIIDNKGTLNKVNSYVVLANVSTGGDILTTELSENIGTIFAIPQTTPNQILTIPAPTDVNPGRVVKIVNSGTEKFTMYNVDIYVNRYEEFVWDGTKWLQQTGHPFINYGARYTNTNTTTNLNVSGGVLAPIFGTADYNDGIYTTTAISLTVTEGGRYDIRANMFLDFISGNIRTSVNAYIEINSVQTGSTAATGYIRSGSGHDRSSLHLSEILNLTAGDIIRIVAFREAANGTVRFTGGTSSFSINKLR